MDDKMEINAWEVLDISGEDKTEYLCKEIQKNKNICNKKANFHNLINHKSDLDDVLLKHHRLCFSQRFEIKFG